MFIFTIQLRVSKPGFVIRFRFKAPCSECYGAFILGYHTQKTKLRKSAYLHLVTATVHCQLPSRRFTKLFIHTFA